MPPCLHLTRIKMPQDKKSVKLRRVDIHEEHKKERGLRFNKQVYGIVHEPIIPKGVVGVWDPPTYLAARRTANQSTISMKDQIPRMLDMRCFYTGVLCKPPPTKPPVGWNQDARVLPWLGTRDHLVPARRHVPGCGQISQYPTTLVWSSNVVNATLGLAPLLVRIKIRQWLMTIPFDRDDNSLESGLNMRWLIIKLVNEFRIEGRFPWSRNSHGDWWNPNISVPFIKRIREKELEFLLLNENDRDTWIKKFNWQF